MDSNQVLLNTIKELEEQVHLFPAYLSGLSHDIRTPLNSIIGFSDLLTAPKITKAEQLLYSRMIARSSRKLLGLMSNLIDLAKIDTGNLILYDQSVNLPDLAEELKEEFTELAALYDKKNIRFSISLNPGLPEIIRSDRNRLFQILNIILDNGLKYTAEGYVDLEITGTEKREIVFRVTDSGCGMSQTILESLFTLFPPDDFMGGKKIQARGMSLLVVKKLIEMMKGSIRVISEPGKGTVVTLFLPVT